MLKVVLLWLGVIVLAAVALATASQYLITPIWLANVFAAFYSIKLRRYLSNYFYIGGLHWSAVLIASVIADHHNPFLQQVVMSLLSALQVVLFVFVYYWLVLRIKRFNYKRTVLLTLPNFISTLICSFIFAFIPEDGVWHLMFFDYFLEQIATGLALLCILYSLSEYKNISFSHYSLLFLVSLLQYFVSVNPLFYNCFFLPLMNVYFTIQYHFKRFVFVMGFSSLMCCMYLTLPLAGQYWKEDEIQLFSHLSTYRVGIASFIVVFLLLSELQMRHRSLSRYLEKVSFYDELTHLKNRRYLKEKVLNRKKQMMYGSILLIDIDNFKKINDKYGHNVGDEVLKLIAKQLKNAVTMRSDIFRWGGEEFLILLKDTQDEILLKQQCQRIIDDCKTNFMIEDVLVPCSVSMGVKQFTAIDQNNYHQMIDRADQMLYQAKAKGKMQYVLDHYIANG